MLQRGRAQAHPHCERHLLREATTTPLRTYLSHTHCNDSNTHGWRALPCATATHTSLHARSWSPRTCASNGGRGDTIGGAGRVPRHGVCAGPPSPTSHVHTPTSSTRPRPQTRRPWTPARKTPTIGRPGGVHMDCMPVAPLAHMGHANQHMRTHHTPALTCPTPRTPYKPTLPPQGRTPGPAHPLHTYRTTSTCVPCRMGAGTTHGGEQQAGRYPSLTQTWPKNVRMTTPTHALPTRNAAHAPHTSSMMLWMHRGTMGCVSITTRAQTPSFEQFPHL